MTDEPTKTEILVDNAELATTLAAHYFPLKSVELIGQLVTLDKTALITIPDAIEDGSWTKFAAAAGDVISNGIPLLKEGLPGASLVGLAAESFEAIQGEDLGDRIGAATQWVWGGLGWAIGGPVAADKLVAASEAMITGGRILVKGLVDSDLGTAAAEAYARLTGMVLDVQIRPVAKNPALHTQALSQTDGGGEEAQHVPIKNEELEEPLHNPDRRILNPEFHEAASAYRMPPEYDSGSSAILKDDYSEYVAEEDAREESGSGYGDDTESYSEGDEYEDSYLEEEEVEAHEVMFEAGFDWENSSASMSPLGGVAFHNVSDVMRAVNMGMGMGPPPYPEPERDPIKDPEMPNIFDPLGEIERLEPTPLKSYVPAPPSYNYPPTSLFLERSTYASQPWPNDYPPSAGSGAGFGQVLPAPPPPMVAPDDPNMNLGLGHPGFGFGGPPGLGPSLQPPSAPPDPTPPDLGPGPPLFPGGSTGSAQ